MHRAGRFGQSPNRRVNPSPEATIQQSHYPRFLLMVLLSFVAMFVLMYAMVDRLDNVHPNLNQFYMAGLMSAAMALIEIGLMRGMYPNGKVNAAIAAGGLVALLGFWLLIRQQTAISDRQFLHSMIPHHGGAILMCERAPIRDAEVRALCESIVAGQRAEIAQMKALLQ
jgi:hypothetical protein